MSEEIEQLSENIDKLSYAVEDLARVMPDLVNNLGSFGSDSAKPTGGIDNGLDQSKQGINKVFGSFGKHSEEVDKFTQQSSKSAKSTAEANKLLNLRSTNLAKGLSDGVDAVFAFTGALTSGVEGYKKYDETVGLATKSLAAFAFFIPFIGPVVAGGILAYGELQKAMSKQADEQNEFVGGLRRLGAATGGTSGDLVDLARDAGYAAKDLAKLSAILTSSSQYLAGLGSTVGQGTETLLKVFDVSDGVQKSFKRIGFNLEQLNAVQTDYIELQTRSGTRLERLALAADSVTAGLDDRIKEEEKNGKLDVVKNLQQQKVATFVQKNSLEYANTLARLQTLTGKTADAMAKEQEQVALDIRTRSQLIGMDFELAELERKRIDGTITSDEELRAKEIVTLKENAEAFRENYSNILGPELTTQIISAGLNGIAGPGQEMLLGLGGNVEEIFAMLRTNGLSVEDMGKVAFDLLGEAQSNIAEFGPIAQYIDEMTQGILGFTPQMLDAFAATNNMTAKEMQEKLAEGGDAAQALINQMKEGIDPQVDKLASLVIVEQESRTLLDKILNEVNFLTTGTRTDQAQVREKLDEEGIIDQQNWWNPADWFQGGDTIDMDGILEKAMSNVGETDLPVLEQKENETEAELTARQADSDANARASELLNEQYRQVKEILDATISLQIDKDTNEVTQETSLSDKALEDALAIVTQKLEDVNTQVTAAEVKKEGEEESDYDYNLRMAPLIEEQTRIQAEANQLTRLDLENKIAKDEAASYSQYFMGWERLADNIEKLATLNETDNMALGTVNARASGGPTNANETYLVGEEGPELFSSNMAGLITSTQDTSAMLESTLASINLLNTVGPLLNSYVKNIDVTSSLLSDAIEEEKTTTTTSKGTQSTFNDIDPITQSLETNSKFLSDLAVRLDYLLAATADTNSLLGKISLNTLNG
jgi:hypothetical protein